MIRGFLPLYKLYNHRNRTDTRSPEACVVARRMLRAHEDKSNVIL